MNNASSTSAKRQGFHGDAYPTPPGYPAVPESHRSVFHHPQPSAGVGFLHRRAGCHHQGYGIATVRAALNELEANGYLTRKRVRGEDGKLENNEYTFYEIPHVGKPAQEKPEKEMPAEDLPA